MSLFRKEFFEMRILYLFRRSLLEVRYFGRMLLLKAQLLLLYALVAMIQAIDEL